MKHLSAAPPQGTVSSAPHTPTTVCEQVRAAAGLTPADIFAGLSAQPYAQLLDWQQSGGVAYVLADPAEIITVTLDEANPDDPGGAFRRLDRTLARWGASNGFVPGGTPVPFSGGAVGMFAYELAHDLENLPRYPEMAPETPLMTVGLYDAVAAFPATTGEEAPYALLLSPWDTAVTRAKRARLRHLIETTKAAPTPSQIACAPPKETVTADAYRAAVGRVREMIHAGDIFQANLSQRFETSLPDGLTPFDIYQRLCSDGTAPFASYLTLGDRTLVSSSPERFVSITPEGAVRTEPIKGTRPRGRTPAEDERLARDLEASDKDRSENVMIVDLLRNDLSRTCADHSVKVEALCELQSFNNVHHLVSVVTGSLLPDATSLDCLAACFPGGSITGAPKVRAMEIIHDEEPYPRGAYCGAIGFVGLDGAMDTSISIRTLTFSNNLITYSVGGGIVADSNPAEEYDETITKASAIRKALTLSDPTQ